MPDWSEINTNVPIIVHHALGCQMVCMNYQNLDKNMKYYLDFFNDGGCAFIKKPSYLCVQKKSRTCPTPPDKKLSFKFNGNVYYGYDGDTLDSALIANGDHLVGISFKYHSSE